MLNWLTSKFRELMSTKKIDQDIETMSKNKEKGSFDGPGYAKARSFEADYHAAIKLLKSRMDHKFPDNYHARLSSRANPTYDHGEQRAAAVDTVSTAVAMSLRNGGTINQAAQAGAKSVGI